LFTKAIDKEKVFAGCEADERTEAIADDV